MGFFAELARVERLSGHSTETIHEPKHTLASMTVPYHKKDIMHESQTLPESQVLHGSVGVQYVSVKLLSNEASS